MRRREIVSAVSEVIAGQPYMTEDVRTLGELAERRSTHLRLGAGSESSKCRSSKHIPFPMDVSIGKLRAFAIGYLTGCSISRPSLVSGKRAVGKSESVRQNAT